MLISMFNLADTEKNGFINKEQLISCIKQDIVFGHDKYRSV